MSSLALLSSLGLLLIGSQLGGTPAVSLDDLIRETLAHSTSVQTARDNLFASRSQVGQANSKLRPQLSLVGSATRYDQASTVEFGGTRIEAVPIHQEELSLVLSQILDLSNQVGTQVSQARLVSLSSEYSLETANEDASLTAANAYYEVLRAARNELVSETSRSAYQEQLKTAETLFKGGVGQRIDVFRAQTQVADADREVVRRANDLEASKSRLNDLIGRPLDQNVKLESPSRTLNEFPMALDRRRLIKEAIDRRPEALGAAIDVRAAQKGIKLARSSTDPQVALGLSGNYFPSTSFQDLRPTTAALTLGVTIPIYDGGLAKDRVNEAKAILDAAKAREDRVRRDIALQVQTAALDLATAHQRLKAANVSVASAIAARALAQQRYDNQVGLYLEVTDAQAALSAAQAAQVDSAYDLLTAQVRLAHALGEPLGSKSPERTSK